MSAFYLLFSWMLCSASLSKPWGFVVVCLFLNGALPPTEVQASLGEDHACRRRHAMPMRAGESGLELLLLDCTEVNAVLNSFPITLQQPFSSEASKHTFETC